MRFGDQDLVYDHNRAKIIYCLALDLQDLPGGRHGTDLCYARLESLFVFAARSAINVKLA